MSGYVIDGARWDHRRYRRALRRIHRKQVIVWSSNDGKTWRRQRHGVKWVDGRVALKQTTAGARFWRLVYRTGDVVVTDDPTVTASVGSPLALTFYQAMPGGEATDLASLASQFRTLLIGELESRRHFWREWVNDWTGTTILPARYQGSYEGLAGEAGARWLAFPMPPDIVAQTDWDGGDGECRQFWEGIGDAPVGRGATPDEALADLLVAIKLYFSYNTTGTATE